MKELKPIKELTEDEFEDFMFLKTDIPKIKSNLKYEFSSIANPYFNKNLPHILVFNNIKINYFNYKTYTEYSIIKISPKPYVLLNSLDIKEEDLTDIFEFIKINKKILMKYWNWKCSSFELKNNVRRINERTNRI